jgi:hypothetical protein
MEIARYDGFVDDALRGVLKSIVIETSFTPPIVINDPFKTGQPGATSALAKYLRPKVTFDTTAGRFAVAPYGSPSDNWPYVRLALLSIGVLAILGLSRWGKR